MDEIGEFPVTPKEISSPKRTDAEIGKALYDHARELGSPPTYFRYDAPVQHQDGNEIHQSLKHSKLQISSNRRWELSSTTIYPDDEAELKTITYDINLLNVPEGSVLVETTTELKDGSEQRRGVRYIPDETGESGTLYVYDTTKQTSDQMYLEEGPERQAVLEGLDADIAPLEEMIKEYNATQV